MFKKGETVIYPKFGVCKVSKIYSESFNEADQTYYELIFTTSDLIISIPIEKAESLGVRYPTPKKELSKKIQLLSKPYKVYDDVLTNIINISNERLASGTIDDAIELIRILRGVSIIKKKKNKPIGLTDKDNLKFCIEFVRGEAALLLGKKVLQKYGLED